MINLSNIKKFLAALAGVAGVLLSNGLIPEQYSKWISGGIAAVSALGVYFLKNGPTVNDVVSSLVNKAVNESKPLLGTSGRENA